jgi:hypothetical protein
MMQWVSSVTYHALRVGTCSGACTRAEAHAHTNPGHAHTKTVRTSMTRLWRRQRGGTRRATHGQGGSAGDQGGSHGHAQRRQGGVHRLAPRRGRLLPRHPRRRAALRQGGWQGDARRHLKDASHRGRGCSKEQDVCDARRTARGRARRARHGRPGLACHLLLRLRRGQVPLFSACSWSMLFVVAFAVCACCVCGRAGGWVGGRAGACGSE